ncbi:MAG: transglycosylase SLT domain-containing protein [Deltaproteobacteria bacterium]|nr:transglycosylase SLT domain-containing protein [Deltaproteobacteria bacterium]
MSGTRVIWIFFVGLGLLLWTGCPVSADVYRYVDKNGVWHFTNIKSDSRYRIYIRTARETPSEYIEKYGAMIKQASRRFGIEPSLIKAVIKAESDFDHRAVSHKGAQGLMQLMPNTAEAMDVDNPFNPEENIFGGTQYLSVLLKRFNNNKRLALAAYNAGPEKVESYRGVPPYKETRTFVKKVFHYYRLYNTRAE